MTHRQSFQGSQQILYENERAVLSVYKRDRTGALDLTAAESRFDDLLIQSVQEQDQEKIQVILADAPKLYAFGTQHRFYTFTASLLDTKLKANEETSLVIGDDSWDGNGVRRWRDFYETSASLSSCAKNNTLVQVFYAGKVIYGAINTMSLNHDSLNQNMYSVVFSMYVVYSTELSNGI